jgi:hypothetical protein
MGWFYATFYNALSGIELWIVVEDDTVQKQS